MLRVLLVICGGVTEVKPLTPDKILSGTVLWLEKR